MIIGSFCRLLDICHGQRHQREMSLYLVFEHVHQDLATYLENCPSPGLGQDRIKVRTAFLILRMYLQPFPLGGWVLYLPQTNVQFDPLQMLTFMMFLKSHRPCKEQISTTNTRCTIGSGKTSKQGSTWKSRLILYESTRRVFFTPFGYFLYRVHIISPYKGKVDKMPHNYFDGRVPFIWGQ